MKSIVSLQLPSAKLLIATTAVAVVTSLSLAFSQPTTLRVDGHRVVSDVPPVTVAREAYLPIRAVAEGLGAEARYDAPTGTIDFVHGADHLRVRIGDTHATLNGQPMTLKHAPFMVRRRAMISTAVIARALGSSVRYDNRTARIDVTTPGVVEAGAPDTTP